MDFPNGMQEKGRDRPAKIFLFSVNPFSGYAFILIRRYISRRDEEVIPRRGGIHDFPG
jgi:hypothetical protein